MHLDRLISILEAVAVAGRPVSAAKLHHSTGLPKPTCYRLLQTLADHRLLERSEHSPGYSIGERLVRIVLMARSDFDICQAAVPALKHAAVELGEAVFLSRFRTDSVEIIKVETPSDPKRSFVHPGLGTRPMHACSCSKAIAAFADTDFQKQILEGPLRAFTKHTKVSRADLAREFEAIRMRGYAECVEELEVGVCSVAVPICFGNAGASFSIAATGPLRRFNRRYRQRIGANLISVSTKVSAAIQSY